MSCWAVFGIWPCTARISGVVPSGSGSLGSTPRAKKFSIAVRLRTATASARVAGWYWPGPATGGGGAVPQPNRAAHAHKAQPDSLDDRHTRILPRLATGRQPYVCPHIIRGKPERSLSVYGLWVVEPHRLLVLVADELDELGVGEQPLIHANRERLRVSRWIINGYVDLQGTEIRPAEALGHLRATRHRAALHVEPDVVAEANRLDDELVAFPVSDGIAVPPGLQILVDDGQGPAVHEDLPKAFVAFIHDDDEVRRLDDLARLRVQVKLRQAHRQAPGVGVVLLIIGHALVAQHGRERRVR